jgi:hypothetical protein
VYEYCEGCRVPLNKSELKEFGKCWWCANGRKRPAKETDIPFLEVERRLQAVVDDELAMPWERKRRR